MTDGATPLAGQERQQEQRQCPHAVLTAAYLDGELGVGAAAQFERHAKECASCAHALREQRRLLCLLDAAFDETFDKSVAPLPAGFTREVKARAQADMSGVRAPGERRRALKICAVLAAAAFALLGVAAFDAVVGPLTDGARAAGSVLGVAGRAGADAGASAGIVFRAVGSRLVAGSEVLMVLQWLALAAGLALLLRLISSYHRARASE